MSRLARPITAGRHQRCPVRAQTSSSNNALMNKPEASSSVRIMRISIAIPPENASRKPPKRGDAPIAQQCAQQIRECQHVAHGVQQRQHAAGARRRGPGLREGGRIADRRQRVERDHLHNAEAAHRAQPIAEQQDRQIAGMIEEFLRQGYVEQEGVVDYPKIHIGDAPIGIPEAGNQEREQHADAEQDQLAAPAQRHQTFERRRAVGAAQCLPKTRLTGRRGLSKFHGRPGLGRKMPRRVVTYKFIPAAATGTKLARAHSHQ